MSFLKRFQVSLDSLYQLPDKTKYVIAYSGGVDSHVLLYCCHQLKLPVRAVHVHHGLQIFADDWVEHCQAICKTLKIQLDIIYVEVQKKHGFSPEEAARNARYAALKKNLQGSDCLLTAQHLNDQAETLLLQLFRTAGSAGLSAMPASRQLGDYFHLRPLLLFSKKEIEKFAREKALHWIEDPSNQDVAYDRNFLRKDILPLLESRWPELTKQLSTVASLQSNNLQVLEDMAAIDLANVVARQSSPLCHSVFKVMSMLSIEKLKQLSSPRLLNLLRYWIITMLGQQPTRNLLKEIEKSLIHSQPDANPNIVFSTYAFRKFQNNLYLLKNNDKYAIQDGLLWNPQLPQRLENLNIQLKVVKTVAEGLSSKLLDEVLNIRLRKGGEKFHPAGRGHSQSLKKLLQEAGVPPWERDVVPLVYFDDELVAVAGLWVSKGFSVGDGESGWVVGVEDL